MNSYENASLNKIIKNTGICTGTFYYHFKNKAALYIFLHESASQVQMDFMDEHMMELGEDFERKDIFEKIKLLTQISQQFAIAHPKYAKLTITFFKEEKNKNNDEIYEYLTSFREKIVNSGIEKMINDAIEDGDFNNKFSKEFIVKIINHLFFNYTEIFPVDENYEMSKYVEDLNCFMDFLKYGLGKY